jgi:tetratricopeptide (TPR) repeat protein
MDWLWEIFANNKDAIDAILKIFGFFGLTSIAGIFGWWLRRWWLQRVRIDVKIFEVITDPAVLLPKLYATENDNSPLADHNIKYQPRNPKQDLQAELKAALNRSRYLLITAPTGYGKTREAGMLAQTMMLEGWHVLRIRTGWLDVPKTLPEELHGNRSRVLILLDDLNGLFSTGNLTQSPRVESEKSLMLSQLSYHDRLMQMLDMFEGMCTESEIRVIATARSEAEQWKVLEYNDRDRLWKRFEKIEISEPIDATIVNLLEDATKQADLTADEKEFKAIAHKSDGTYRNILLNLRRCYSQNKPVDKDDFTDTLDGSWRDIYERAVKKHPAAKYVYDGIDVLRQAGIELFPFLVEPTALMIWGGNPFQKFLRERQVRRALRYLTRETKILRLEKGELSPSDGQIEAKSNAVSWTLFDAQLLKLLLDSPDKKTITSIYGLAVAFYYEKQFEKSSLLIGRYTQLNPSDPDGYNVAGVLLASLKRYEEAEASYRNAIELDPSYANAYYNLGILLQNLKRYEEAEASYRNAIELNPSYANAYYNLGILLQDLKRYEEAEASYRNAIEFNPSDATAYYNLGILLQDLKRYDEAEASYRNVIEFNPSYANAYSSLGNLLQNLKRYDEAEASYRNAIELNPSYANTYYNLGIMLQNLKRYEEAEASYRNAIKLNPSLPEVYCNLGILLEDLKRYGEAEAAYRRATELNPSDATAYFNLGILLDDLKRYDEAEAAYRKAIELNPSYANAYFNLGILLDDLKHYDEAEAAYRKAIELNPSDANAYFNLGNLLSDENLKRYEEAEAAYRKAIELDPSDAGTYGNLGNLLRDNFPNRADEAKIVYYKAIEINPNDYLVFLNLGGLHENLKRYEEAEASYRKAIESNPAEAGSYHKLVPQLD